MARDHTSCFAINSFVLKDISSLYFIKTKVVLLYDDNQIMIKSFHRVLLFMPFSLCISSILKPLFI